MSKLYNVIKMIIPGSKQKTYGTGVIKSVKPTVPKTEKYKIISAHKIKMAKIPGEVSNKFKKTNEMVDSALTRTRQDLQKLRGEKITKSGFSKGKDIKND